MNFNYKKDLHKQVICHSDPAPAGEESQNRLFCRVQNLFGRHTPSLMRTQYDNSIFYKNLYIILLFFPLLITALLFSGCEKNTLPLIPPEYSHSGYIIVNEGLYGQNNSSLTFYDLQKGKAEQNIYANENNGSNLGDTANDLSVCCDKAFIVVDKSKKVEVISTENFKSEGFIDFSDYGSPRNIIITDSLHGYISTLNDLVVEINPSKMNVIRTIPVGSKPEGLTINGANLFVANSGFGVGTSLSVIDTSAHSVISTINVWQNPNVLLSRGNYVYAVSIGKYDPAGIGAVTKIDAVTLMPADTILIGLNPGKAAIADDKLFVINGEGLQTINLEDFSLSDSTFIKGSEVNPITGVIYSIFFDEIKNEILLTNPKDFLQNGEIVIFNLTGKKIKTFNAGLNPGKISLITK